MDLPERKIHKIEITENKKEKLRNFICQEETEKLTQFLDDELINGSSIELKFEKSKEERIKFH